MKNSNTKAVGGVRKERRWMSVMVSAEGLVVVVHLMMAVVSCKGIWCRRGWDMSQVVTRRLWEVLGVGVTIEA